MTGTARWTGWSSLGATRADVGQDGSATWVVLADPEGNEFCVLSTRSAAPA